MPTLQDRGAARHFHGRRTVLKNFMEELALARADSGGTTFLIQGPPGAGKTALLHKCAEEAEKAEWRTVEIRPDALHDPAIFMEELGERYEAERVDTGGAGAGSWIHVVWESHKAGMSVKGLIKRAAKKGGLLLVLDEAQMIARYGYGQGGDVSGDVGASLEGVLSHIHNGKIGAPVVLLAGGLGTSRLALQGVGISRFKGDCLVNLGHLSPVSERAVITDWLVKDGKAQKGEALDRWIRAIADETDGWPQHIMAYIQPAAHLAAGVQGQLTDEGLAGVLDQGRRRKADYYEARAEGFRDSECRAIAAMGAEMKSRSGLTDDEIIARLAKSGVKDPNELFSQAVWRGILARTPGRRYGIPIPSMRRWLEETFLPERERPTLAKVRGL